MAVKLTHAEKVAKDFMIRLVQKGLNTPVAEEISKDEEISLPHWYNEMLYKRGQQYFWNNLYGQTLALVYGLLTILSEPRDLKILDTTGKSSDKESARKRYMSTVGHIICWLRFDLKPGTLAWKSLKKTRNTHSKAAKFGVSKGLGGISQLEMTLVSFNFLGYQLNRPQHLGIKSDNKEDREAFIHFWAVIIHMLGIKDEFNLAFHPIEVVEAICEICMRYIFNPLVQLETPRVERMYNAFMDGIGYYIPHSSYGSVMFFIKRLIGIPGCHYITDTPTINFEKQFFTDNEFKYFANKFDKHPHFAHLKGLVVAKPMYLINIENSVSSQNSPKKLISNVPSSSEIFDLEALQEILELSNPKDITFVEVNKHNYSDLCDQSKFYELRQSDQVLVMKSLKLNKTMSSPISKFLSKIVANLFLSYMFWKNARNKQIKKKN